MMARRDAAGIGRFFNEEYRAMLAFVRGLIRDAAERDGEDVVQDVMLRLLEAPDPALPIEAWLRVYRALATAWSIYSAAARPSAAPRRRGGPR